MWSLAVASWLASGPGLVAVAATTDLLDADVAELTVATRLRDGRVPGGHAGGLDAARAAAVVEAAVARRAARARFADADRLLLTRDAVEQASDPTVSAWRAGWIDAQAPGTTVVDLCAGIGGDAMAMAATGRRVIAVEHDPVRAVLLAHNARVRGLPIEVREQDALHTDIPPGAVVHADPGRRRDGRRVRRLADHQPPVAALLARVHAAAGVALTLSPAVDLDDPDLPADAELGFLQVGDDLRETTVWLGALRDGTARASATLLPTHPTAAVIAPRDVVRRARTARGPRLAVGDIGSHLVEVAPAAVRARLHDDIGATIHARRIADRRALLTTDAAPPPDPWYRARPVEQVVAARPAVVRRYLRSVDPAPVELVLHGIDVAPDAWLRALGSVPRGPHGRRIELIRTDRGAVAVITAAGRDAT